MSLFSPSFEAPVPLEETPSPEEEEEAEPLNPLLALALRQQKRQQEAQAELEKRAAQHGQQAAGLRSMALLSSFGSNPLLRNLQGEAGRQGAQLQGMAERAEGRLGAGRLLDPLGIARLQLAAERLAHDRERAAKELGFKEAQAEAKAQSARLKASAGAEARREKAKLKGIADLRKMEDTFRKEVLLGDTGKDYLRSKSSYEAILGYVSHPSPSTDMALVFGAMKTLDPTSVVKEGEQIQVRNTTNIPGRMLNYFERAKSGESFSQAQREELAQMAFLSLQSKAKTLKGLSEAYKPLVEEAGGNMRRVMPLGLEEATAPVPGAKTGATTPKRTPAHQALPSGPGGSLLLGPAPKATAGDTVRVKINGMERPIPRSKLEAFRARAAQLKDKFEVIDG